MLLNSVAKYFNYAINSKSLGRGNVLCAMPLTTWSMQKCKKRTVQNREVLSFHYNNVPIVLFLEKKTMGLDKIHPF